MITMKEVAERAGVSRSTASFALSGRQEGVRIPEETRRRILDVASELGYMRNELARAVVTGKSRFIGLLLRTPKRDVEFQSRIMTGVLEEAAELDYNVKVIYLPDESALSEAVHRCVEWRMAGLVTVSLSPEAIDGIRAEVMRHKIALAVVEGVHPVQWGIHVVSDCEQGIRLAVQHFQELGHHKIAHLAAAAGDTTSTWRVNAFKRAMTAQGLPVRDEYIVHGAWTLKDVTHRAAHHLLELPDPPTAMLCSGDRMGVWALNVARNRGLVVPRDLSVIGFGDYALAELSDPELTTIAQPLEAAGRRVVRRLIEQVFAQETTSAPLPVTYPMETLPVRLVVRGSTGPAPEPKQEILAAKQQLAAEVSK